MLIWSKRKGMTTDWNLIRELMNSVIDACEAIDELVLTANDRDAPTGAGPSNVYDVLQSAWTYPENARYAVICSRHDLGDDKHYTPESARAIVHVAQLCGELVGASNAETIQKPAREVAQWYREQMTPQITKAIDAKRGLHAL